MKRLQITQVDRFLKPFAILKDQVKPKSGWVRYIRKSLGMTVAQLAMRLNVSRRRVTKIEQDELQEALTIKTLKTVANAMECQFVYAIIPNTTILETIEEQAKKLAIKNLQETAHNMNLEMQAVTDPKIIATQIEELLQQYFNQSSKHLWNI